ncbi:hypothetical protein [Euzebya pacifica]|uniref:hypothetical protein n=1 Tax=Euzebya pacifica TaxID=1608957 RepID=UPI0030FBEF38
MQDDDGSAQPTSVDDRDGYEPDGPEAGRPAVASKTVRLFVVVFVLVVGGLLAYSWVGQRRADDAEQAAEAATEAAIAEYQARSEAIAASPLGQCIEVSGNWAFPLGEAAALGDTPSYQSLFREMTLQVGTSSPEWQVINDAAGAFGIAAIEGGRPAGAVAAHRTIEDACVALYGTIDDQPGVDFPAPAVPAAPLAADPDDGVVVDEVPAEGDVGGFVAAIRHLPAFADDSDRVLAAHGLDACAALDGDPTAANPMDVEDLAFGTFDVAGQEQLWVAAVQHLCPEHEPFVTAAADARESRHSAPDERAPVAPEDVPDWAFEDPQRVAEAVMPAFLAGDLSPVDRLVAGEILEQDWGPSLEVDDLVPVCETLEEFRVHCFFDDVYLLEVHRDRVTLQWIVRAADDFSGI